MTWGYRATAPLPYLCQSDRLRVHNLDYVSFVYVIYWGVGDYWRSLCGRLVGEHMVIDCVVCVLLWWQWRQRVHCYATHVAAAAHVWYLIIWTLSASRIPVQCRCSVPVDVRLCYPFAVKTAGTWHDMAIELTQELADASQPAQKTPGKQRLSTAL